MSTNYHKVLGIEPGADLATIKKAYRRLAMRYHPDRNPEPRAEEAFILVNEAYEYLSNPRRREHRTPSGYDWSKQEPEWDREREMARERARAHAQQRAEQFQQSRIYRAAMVLDRFYDYLFIAIGFLMALWPVISWMQMEPEEKADRSPWGLLFPIIIGSAFIYGIWYFLFKLRNEE